MPPGWVRLDSSSFGTTETDCKGQILAARSGLHFYSLRYYDSALGRFISADGNAPRNVINSFSRITPRRIRGSNRVNRWMRMNRR